MSLTIRSVITVSASLGLLAGTLLTVPPVLAEDVPEQRWSLEERACDDESLDGWDCYTLVVPRDWDNLDDTLTSRIAMAVKPATGKARDRIGAMTFNPGGPGSRAWLPHRGPTVNCQSRCGSNSTSWRGIPVALD